MPADYSLTQIYKIQVGDDVYIGHTSILLEVRRQAHVKCFKKNPDRKAYRAMHDAGWCSNDIKLLWVEDFPCPDKSFAEAREKEYIVKVGTLNCTIPHDVCSERKQEYRDLLVQNEALKDDEAGRKEREAKRVKLQQEWEKVRYQANKEATKARSITFRARKKQAALEARATQLVLNEANAEHLNKKSSTSLMEDSDYLKQLETKVENKTTRRNYIGQLKVLMEKIKKKQTEQGEDTPAKLIRHILTHPRKYSEMIEQFYTKDTTRKTALTTVLAVFKYSDSKCEYDKHYKKWKQFHDKYKDLVAEAIESNEPSKSQKEKYISFETMQDGINKLAKDDPHSTKRKSLQFCLVNMYMYIRPKRADFGDIQVFSQKNLKNTTDNYLVLPTKGPAYFMFNHRTKTPMKEPLIEPVDSKLKEIFQESIKKHPRDFLFVGQDNDKFKSPGSFSKFVIRTYETVFGKKVGVSMHRHIYTSEKIDFQKMPHKLRKEISSAMGHSIIQQDLYHFASPPEQ